MRYGENVLEANKKPDWSCPSCRGMTHDPLSSFKALNLLPQTSSIRPTQVLQQKSEKHLPCMMAKMKMKYDELILNTWC